MQGRILSARFFIGNCLYLSPQIFDLVGGRYAVQTIMLIYKYNPISFGKPKETGLRPERKVFYPLLFAPANAVPFQKGTKTHHRQDCGFQSRPLPLGVGSGFHLIFLAQLYYRRQKKNDCFLMK